LVSVSVASTDDSLDNRPVTQVAKLLGHSDPSVTMKRYAHWFRQLEERNRDAMIVLANDLFGSSSVAEAVAAGVSA
jgi:integrase